MIEDEHFGTLGSTNQEQGFGTVDSMPSSTQTAHSWVPGMQDGNQNVNNVVGRARSFEYLPGNKQSINTFLFQLIIIHQIKSFNDRSHLRK